MKYQSLVSISKDLERQNPGFRVFRLRTMPL